MQRWSAQKIHLSHDQSCSGQTAPVPHIVSESWISVEEEEGTVYGIYQNPKGYFHQINLSISTRRGGGGAEIKEQIDSSLLHLGPVNMEGGCPSWATRLEGLQHSLPLHATHLTGTVSGLRELSLERSLSTTAGQGNFFPSYFSFLHGHGPILCLRLVCYIDPFRLTVIQFGR